MLALGTLPGRVASARTIPAWNDLHSQPVPSDLIGAVNALRASRGLPALKMHPILTQTAQSQANALLASNGAVGHSRPAGMSFTEQLIQLGYPLAGDLSLGGFRSENYVFGNNLSVQDAIQFWLGDEPHTNTMLSPNYVDIGAGVAVDGDGTVYLVIDCARPTSSGAPQSDASSVLTVTVRSPSELLSQYIIPVALSTARPDGVVYHKVQYGQTLWGIAIVYGTTINNLRTLNNLSDTIVYEGQVLLVRRGATQPAPVSSATSTTVASSPTMPIPADEGISPSATPADTPTPTPASSAGGPSAGLMLGVFFLVMVAGAISAALFIRQQN
jgi:LysM repeat protein